MIDVAGTCPYCSKAVTALGAAGVEYTAIERTQEMANALLAKTGTTSVPSTWVKGTFVGGCNDGPEDWMGVLYGTLAPQETICPATLSFEQRVGFRFPGATLICSAQNGKMLCTCGGRH